MVRRGPLPLIVLAVASSAAGQVLPDWYVTANRQTRLPVAVLGATAVPSSGVEIRFDACAPSLAFGGINWTGALLFNDRTVEPSANTLSHTAAMLRHTMTASLGFDRSRRVSASEHSRVEYDGCWAGSCPEVPEVVSEHLMVGLYAYENSSISGALDGLVTRRNGALLYSAAVCLGFPDGFSYWSTYDYCPDCDEYGVSVASYTEYGAGDYALDLDARMGRWYWFTTRSRDRSLLFEVRGNAGSSETRLRYREDIDVWYDRETTVGPTTFFRGYDLRLAGVALRAAYGETDVLRTALNVRTRLGWLRAAVLLEELSLQIGASWRDQTTHQLIRWERDGAYSYGHTERTSRTNSLIGVSRGVWRLHLLRVLAGRLGTGVILREDFSEYGGYGGVDLQLDLSAGLWIPIRQRVLVEGGVGARTDSDLGQLSAAASLGEMREELDYYSSPYLFLRVSLLPRP